LIDRSPHEDDHEYTGSTDTSIDGSHNEKVGNENDIVIDEEELMITVDDILSKIVSKFPEKVT
jgi:hypothetical protein